MADRDSTQDAVDSEAAKGRSGFGWPHALTVTAIALLMAVGVVTLSTLYGAKKVSEAAIDRSREVVEDLQRIASAFNSGTVETRFLAYATEISGNNYLQVATLSQYEIFRRKDSATTLWGALALPDVVVEARAPVETTYYLDLSDTWQLSLVNRSVIVRAPALRFNKPAIDASELAYEIRQGSLIRDETEQLVALKSGLSAMAELRASENIAVIRETARNRAEEFVENWMLRAFVDDFDERSELYRIEVIFADEAEAGETLPGVVVHDETGN